LIAQGECCEAKPVHQVLIYAGLTIVEHEHRHSCQGANKEDSGQVLEEAEVKADAHTHFRHFANACAAPACMPALELAI
jgi:hypothetical protein